MKILLATGLYPPEVGGPATYTKLLEDELPKRGFEVVVLPFRDVRQLPSGIRHLMYFWKCYSLAKKCDVVYAQDTVSVGLPAALAAEWAHKKFLVRVPGDYAWEQARQRFGVEDELDEFQQKKYGWRVELLRNIQKFDVKSAVKVVVPSEYMKRIVSGWVESNRVITIYSSVELPEIEEIKNLGEFLVVSSGRRVPWKNFDAIERVVEREAGWKFFLAENLPRPQALGWVKAANVFVLNSTYEGLSHALVEAMMLGTPIVATNVGGNPELIRDGVDGLLIPAKDDEALYAALKKVATDPASAKIRAESAFERAKLFSMNASIEKLVELLKTI